MKLLIDGLGNADKAVLRTNVTQLSGPGARSRTECDVKTQVVDQDMQGGDICSFNMTHEPSHAACGRACCGNERCDHFVSVSGDPPYSFKGGGVCDGQPPCAQNGFCCFLKTNATRPIKSSYKPGTAIGGTTTPSRFEPAAVEHPVYARAFAPAEAGWPGPEKRAVLLANFDSRHNHTVALAGEAEGFRRATLWSVVHGASGAWDTPFARRKSMQDTLTMEPLAVYLAFVPSASKSERAKLDDSDGSANPSRCPLPNGTLAPCGPGNEQCTKHGRFTRSPAVPQYHLMDLSCGEQDPNGPIFDPVHAIYHHFCKPLRCFCCFFKKRASNLVADRSKARRRAEQGHAMAEQQERPRVGP